jgi:L-aspartate oxidase
MTDHVSVIRSLESLARADRVLMDLANGADGVPCTDDWETTNLHTVATVLTAHALFREETRGSHWREDFPERDDERWRVRLVSRMSEDGDINARLVPVRGGVIDGSE